MAVENPNYIFWMNENGFIGEHYKVVCLMDEPGIEISPDGVRFGEDIRTCLVDAYEFNKWVKRENSIKWI